jgi:hypothetical protein
MEGEAAWALPWEASFLGLSGPELPIVAALRFTVPLRLALGNFNFSLKPIDGREAAAGINDAIFFELQSLELTERWYGFTLDVPGTPAERTTVSEGSPPEQGGGFSATPFVFARAGEGITIDPPPEYRISGSPELYIDPVDGPVMIQAGALRYEYRPGGNSIYIPAGAIAADPFPIDVTGNITSIELIPVQGRPFPAEPVPADPELILNYRQESWRDSRFEVFRWDGFPSILIFDTADYEIQSRLFKRLAFFVEKRDFRGRLAADAEIAELHGWNAHDYRAEDLARFFQTARTTNFPLLEEERELEAILISAGILKNSGGSISAGEGAIISLSRESPDYLRSLFMVHEGYHGLFFIDEDFRNFSAGRWNALNRTAKRFILSYFDSQRYDLEDEYLMVNEFMAYCLQQSVSAAGNYFGKTLAGRINDNSWRRQVLPPRDAAAENWPELAAAFTAEAEAFSNYVSQRWGLAAGRVRKITVRGL